MMKIGDILKDTFHKRAFGKRVSEAVIFLDYPKLVGENIANISRPLYFSSGTLFVGVESPIWSHHLHYLKPEILEKLNTPFDKKLVRDIKFKLATIESSCEKPETVPPPSAVVNLTSAALDRIKDTCGLIDDVELREGFQRWMKKDAKYQRKIEGKLN